MKKKQIDKIDLLHLKIESLQKAINRLKQEKEDLKCCGNCENADSKDCRLYVREKNSNIKKAFCNDWESDYMRQQDRKFGYE